VPHISWVVVPGGSAPPVDEPHPLVRAEQEWPSASMKSIPSMISVPVEDAFVTAQATSEISETIGCPEVRVNALVVTGATASDTITAMIALFIANPPTNVRASSCANP
jgi:hypothetical protein